jgi:hypothetical protein
MPPYRNVCFPIKFLDCVITLFYDNKVQIPHKMSLLPSKTQPAIESYVVLFHGLVIKAPRPSLATIFTEYATQAFPCPSKAFAISPMFLKRHEKETL